MEFHLINHAITQLSCFKLCFIAPCPLSLNPTHCTGGRSSNINNFQIFWTRKGVLQPVLKGLGKAPGILPCLCTSTTSPKLPHCFPYPTCIPLSLLKCRAQLIQSIFLGRKSCLERWRKSSWSKLHHHNSSHTPVPAPPQPGVQSRSKISKAHPEHQLDLEHPEQPRAFIWRRENIPPNFNQRLSKAQVFTVTKQTPVQLQASAVPQAARKVSGCRAECIIGLIYSYQHGTWFESSITVTSHSGVCMLQRASKLERNLPPAAEHYITINRKQAESSRRSPSLACTVMLMEMYTHSSICTYYGACQTVGLHCEKESRAQRDKTQAKSFKTPVNPLRFPH